MGKKYNSNNGTNEKNIWNDEWIKKQTESKKKRNKNSMHKAAWSVNYNYDFSLVP